MAAGLPPYAGELIEYNWATSKNYYRRRPMKDKRGRAKFIETVKSSFGAVTTEVARKNARRQRGYIKAYAILDGHMDGNNFAGMLRYCNDPYFNSIL